MFLAKAKLICNSRVQGNYFHCVFLSPSIAQKACAGQFIDIRLAIDASGPLLRRPFSIHNASRSPKGGGRIVVLYEVVGKGTEILSQKKAGEYLDVVGPLGNGFDLRQETGDSGQAILVAGGMGVAPLVFLAEKLARIKPVVLIGARSKSQILCEKEFRSLGSEVKVATDDGSQGFKGRVTDLLQRLLLTLKRGPITIYSCGPGPMLKEISSISKKYNVAAQISLEAHMACGIGACLGCVVNTSSGYKRVCKEGPVFNAAEIVW